MKIVEKILSYPGLSVFFETDGLALTPDLCNQLAEIEKSGKPGIIKVGNLEAIRDFSDVRDIVRAYKLIIEKWLFVLAVENSIKNIFLYYLQC